MEMTISISASVFFSHFFFPFSNSPLQMKRCFSSDLIQPICTLCFSYPTFGTLWPSDIFRAHYHSHAVSFSFFLPIFLLFFKKKKKTWRRVFKCVLYIFYPHFLTSRLLLSFFRLSYLLQSAKPPLQRVTNDLSPLDFLILSPVSP